MVAWRPVAGLLLLSVACGGSSTVRHGSSNSDAESGRGGSGAGQVGSGGRTSAGAGTRGGSGGITGGTSSVAVGGTSTQPGGDAGEPTVGDGGGNDVGAAGELGAAGASACDSVFYDHDDGGLVLTTGGLLSDGSFGMGNAVIESVVYEPTANVVYGIDTVNKLVAYFDLGTGYYVERFVKLVPNALCVNAARSRVFVVNSGSTVVSELSLPTLALVRNIQWPSPSYEAPSDARFQIYCGADRLYVVDSEWSPTLWTIEDLDGCPTATVRAPTGVGGLVLAADEQALYYWGQYGRVAGQAGTSVARVDTTTWLNVDQAAIGYTDGFYRDPLDTPILWDHTRGVILAKNRVFDAEDLTHVLYTFTDPSDAALVGARQNAYALDEPRGRFATRHDVFSLTDYGSLATVADPAADQYFFDADGALWMLQTSAGRLLRQSLD